jgi:putative lipoic acid-binding regulatory protein
MTKKPQAASSNNGGTSLLEFPCRFPIKAMGRHSSHFEALVLRIVERHAELWPGEPVRSVASKAGNYLSVTAVVRADSREQLDAIYQDLTDHEDVLMAF